MPPTPVPTPGFLPVDGLKPLSRSEMGVLAGTLTIDPFHIIAYNGLRRGIDRAFVAGRTTDPEAVIVQHASEPEEPVYFGRDP
ncbi:MAG: hypothetical protein L3J97_06915, partial [Thermoplasmata archaeon]|nr:hypothetical protein [Thermoplasmata archaeon]